MRQLLVIFFITINVSASEPSPTDFDYKTSLKYSQAAINNTIGDYTFVDSYEQPFVLKRNKPFVLSLVYTSCYHTCPMTTRNLAKVVKIAREALGNDSFDVITIGFDTKFDTPKTMRYFATQQGIENISDWYYLSADEKTINALIKDLGFIFYPSPRGYDHIVQATVVAENGKVYRQVYGEVFDTPLLVEPLKQLILGQSKPNQPFLEDLISKVRFFCTTYDPNTDNYYFDYSLFIGMFIGASIVLLTILFLFRELKK
ncbi:SCO family protein [Candidatus Halobeggiatoa sp. HSG11]|nr:SCO family protein [Candidatus Halobeggiatoa sp. HSG11]